MEKEVKYNKSQELWLNVSKELIKIAESVRYSPLPFFPIELALVDVILDRQKDERQNRKRN